MLRWGDYVPLCLQLFKVEEAFHSSLLNHFCHYWSITIGTFFRFPFVFTLRVVATVTGSQISFILKSNDELNLEQTRLFASKKQKGRIIAGDSEAYTATKVYVYIMKATHGSQRQLSPHVHVARLAKQSEQAQFKWWQARVLILTRRNSARLQSFMRPSDKDHI